MVDERHLHVYCIASDPRRAEKLVQTADHVGLTVHVTQITWTGYVDKLRTFKRILASDDIDPEDVVVFVDAYDVLCYAPADEIMRKYDAMKCDLVLSGELNCFPATLADAYAMLHPIEPASRTRYTYVNSGGIVGTKAALLDMLNWKTPDVQAQMSTSENGTDQHYVSRYYLENKHRRFTVKLDTEQEIFQCMFQVELTECSFRQGRFHNDVLGTQPCFVHFNGFCLYKYRMRNQVTGDVENILDAFVAMAKRSESERSESGSVVQVQVQVQYEYPHPIMFNGAVLRPVPQLKTTS